MYNTEREACSAWVREFNEVPVSILNKLIDFEGYEAVQEITPICKGSRVVILNGEHVDQEGEVIETACNETEGLFKIELDSTGEHVLAYREEINEIDKEDYFPMWSTLWSFKNAIDEEWLLGKWWEPQLEYMAELGFRIYRTEDFGIVFGIDGAGYDFYEAHWIPLYRLRGLRWHKQEGS